MTDAIPTPTHTFSDYPSWVAAVWDDLDADTIRLAFADWLEENDDPEEATAQRAACKQVRTRRVSAVAVPGGTWAALRDHLIPSSERRWISKSVCTTVHFLRGVPGGEIDVWVDDRILTPVDDRMRMLLERGSLPLDAPEGRRLGLVIEVHDKIGSFAGRRWSINLRFQQEHQRIPDRMVAARLEIERTNGQVHLSLCGPAGPPHWCTSHTDRSRMVSRPDEVASLYLWHWRRYYSFLPREDAEQCALALAGTLPPEGEDVNELNRRLSRELYAQARAAGWRKLTHREQRKYGVVGQWHRTDALDARRAAHLANPSGCGDATLRAAAGLPESGFGPTVEAHA